MDQTEELAAVVDVTVDRCERTWEVGHELAKRWTESDRSMTPAEAAIARLFQFQLDPSGRNSKPYRNWWLDGAEDVIEAESVKVWAEVVPHLKRSWAVAHTSDFLWLNRFGNQSYEWAVAASEHYRLAAQDEQDDRLAIRFLFRALGLAGEINHVEQRTESERAVIDRLEAIARGDDRATAVSAAVRLRSEDLGAPTALRLKRLLESLWTVVESGPEREKVGKALVSYTDDAEIRLSIAEGIIEAFRSDAADRKDMGKLLSLREAARVAEEMGHPSHSAILHEIETLDSEDIFQRIGVEHAMSRSDVSDFCSAIVGTDSLQNALLRFVATSPLTPEAVESIRASTEVGIRHTIQRQQIGEANSVVTTSEGDDNSIEAAVDRDVRQTAGFNGQVTSFFFLSPALHQALETYHPWPDEEVTSWIEGDTSDGVVSSALVRSLNHFRERRYDEAVHILVPRVERQIRMLARACGVATTKRPTARVGGIRGLGEIVADLRAGRGASGPLLPEPLITSVELLLVDPESLNMRNEVAHGISGLGDQWQATLLIQLCLAIALAIQLGDPETS